MLKSSARSLSAVICVLGLGLLSAACGSDSSSSDDTADGSSSSVAAEVETSKDTVAELSDPPPFEVESIAGGVPTGKVVASVNCNVPACSPGQMEEPVVALGWTYNEFSYDITKGAQDYVRAVNAALASKPDFLAIDLSPGQEVVARQLEQAKSEGIPVIGIGGKDAENMAVNIQGPVPLKAAGGYSADVAIADAAGPVKMGIAIDPAVAPLQFLAEGAKDRLSKVSGSRADVIELSFGRPQPTNVSGIINYLKSHPDTEYLFFPGDAFYAGVQQALQAAGLADKVKLVLAYPNVSDLKSIEDGEWLGVVAGESTFNWRAVDAMARLAAGETLPTTDPSNEFRLMTEENATEEALNPADFQPAYKEAWGV